FSIKICNSECEEAQTCPLDLGQIRRRAIDIPRAPRAQEPLQNHCRDYRNLPKEEQGRVPAATVQKPHGAALTSPQGLDVGPIQNVWATTAFRLHPTGWIYLWHAGTRNCWWIGGQGK
ncbi:hypothetical protein ILYODFUR_012209, partial [Ilyodon furcidens]